MILQRVKIHFDNPQDRDTKLLVQLVDSSDLCQHVSLPTHRQDRILDWVIQRSAHSNRIYTLSPLKIYRCLATFPWQLRKTHEDPGYPWKRSDPETQKKLIWHPSAKIWLSQKLFTPPPLPRPQGCGTADRSLQQHLIFLPWQICPWDCRACSRQTCLCVVQHYRTWWHESPTSCWKTLEKEWPGSAQASLQTVT